MIALQLFGWLLVLTTTLLLTINPDMRRFDLAMFVVRIVPLLLIYIINYVVIIPKLLFKNKTLLYFMANALLIASLLFAFYCLKEGALVENLRPEGKNSRPPHRQYMFLAYETINYILMIGLVTAIQLSSRLRKSEVALEEAENARIKAELMNLKSQINPHFLLNTLNNIYALTAIDVERAQKTIHELSRLLEYVLYDNSNEKVSLLKEVEFLKNYIELMRIRLNTNVKVSVQFNITPQSSTQIAPLIFISLIENAFKHGVGTHCDSFIEIIFKDIKETNEVVLSIKNSNHAKTESDKSGNGIGLAQVKKRLELQYPNAYQWIIEENKEYYSSILTIKLEE